MWEERPGEKRSARGGHIEGERRIARQVRQTLRDERRSKGSVKLWKMRRMSSVGRRAKRSWLARSDCRLESVRVSSALALRRVGRRDFMAIS